MGSQRHCASVAGLLLAPLLVHRPVGLRVAWLVLRRTVLLKVGLLALRVLAPVLVRAPELVLASMLAPVLAWWLVLVAALHAEHLSAP